MNVFDKVLRSVGLRRRHDLGDAAAFGVALGLGAGLMYTLDPAGGARRRASAIDRAVGLAQRTGALLDERTRDLAPIGERLDLTRASGSPAARLLMGALGVGLVGYAIRRRGPLGALLGVAGAALLLREISDRPARGALDAGAGRHVGTGRPVVAFRRTITVRAPIRDVFLSFIQFESFPRFMSHLRQVETIGDGRMRWTAVGPAGIPVSWDAELTQLVPNEVVAWRSLPGEAIESEGIVRLEEAPEGTRLHIGLSYTPPAGAVATLFGAEPEHVMDEDLARLKTLIEEGKTTVHADEVVLGDLQGAR
ncbi:SRPBCC family protein [Sorangium sp. So ce233]|uniref:SRPBCC family protein n=1 Tax=Sorangium sp. So ce233 TaxID=3133290 RepID=UPI003F642E59